jgi:hypothetical protein
MVLESAQLIESCKLQLTKEPRPPCWQLKLATRFSNRPSILTCIPKVHATCVQRYYKSAPHHREISAFVKKGSHSRSRHNIFSLTSSSTAHHHCSALADVISHINLLLSDVRASQCFGGWFSQCGPLISICLGWTSAISFASHLSIACFKFGVAPGETLFSNCSLAYFFRGLTSVPTKDKKTLMTC